MPIYATLVNDKIANTIVADSLEDAIIATGDKNAVEITGLNIGLGWKLVNGSWEYPVE